MATRIFPTENDVHDVSGGGRKPTEENLTNFRKAAKPQISHYRQTSGGEEKMDAGGTISGFAFSAGTATSITLTAGIATIEGYYIDQTTTIGGTLVANMFNYVFLTLDKTATLVTGISLTIESVALFNSPLTVPADSILLHCFETDGASVITQFDFRTSPSNAIHGFYIGDGAATRTIDLGFRPKLVQLITNEDPRLIAQSQLDIPRASGMQYGSVMVDHNGNATPYITNDPELVPVITEDGFTVEDGPGTLQGVWLRGSKAFDPPNVISLSTFTTTVTVPGAESGGSLVAAHHDAMTAGQWALVPRTDSDLGSYVSATDTVTVVFKNVTGLSINLANDTLTALVFEAAPKVLWSLNELNKSYYFIAWF